MIAEEDSVLRQAVEHRAILGSDKVGSHAVPNDNHNVFGDQDGYYKHALIKATEYCDNIFAVGDYTLKEMRFLGPDFAAVDMQVAYNGVPAVRDLSLSVGRGEIVGLIGPNGAGKSTTLHAIMGIVRPAGGSAPLRQYSTHERSTSGGP